MPPCLILDVLYMYLLPRPVAIATIAIERHTANQFNISVNALLHPTGKEEDEESWDMRRQLWVSHVP